MIEKVKVGNREYTVVKVGIDQAEQVIALSKWLAQYGVPIFNRLANDETGQIPEMSNVELIGAILDGLEAEALVSLHSVLIGCTVNMSKKYFDIGQLIDVALTIWERQPGIRKVFGRFFSTPGSEDIMEE